MHPALGTAAPRCPVGHGASSIPLPHCPHLLAFILKTTSPHAAGRWTLTSPPPHPPQTYITLIHSHLKKRDSPRPADIDQTHQDSLIGPAWVTCSILSQSLGPEGEALSPGGVWLSYPSLRRVSSTKSQGPPKNGGQTDKHRSSP